MLKTFSTGSSVYLPGLTRYVNLVSYHLYNKILDLFALVTILPIGFCPTELALIKVTLRMEMLVTFSPLFRKICLAAWSVFLS